MATQEQRRRGTAAQVQAMTPALGEVVYDTTNKRLYLGDGSTAGGIPAPNAPDLHTQTFLVGTVGGTADAITLTLTPAPTGYATGEKVCWINTGGPNTGAVTINKNGLGAKALKKNVTEALAADDLKDNGYYEAVYDGTNYQLTNAAAGGSGEVFVASATASGAASMILPVTAGYDFYVLSALMKPATDGVVPKMEFSVDGGSTYLTGNSGNLHELATNTIQGLSSQKLLGDTANSSRVGNDAGDGVGIELVLPSLAGTQRKRFSGTITYTGSEATGSDYGGPIYGANTTQSAVTHIKLSFSSGNIASGWASLNAKRRT